MRIDFCGDGTGRKISLWYFGAFLVLFSFLVRYFSYVWDPVISRDGILYLQAANWRMAFCRKTVRSFFIFPRFSSGCWDSMPHGAGKSKRREP